MFTRASLLLGLSAAMTDISDLSERFARVDDPILLLGERGTGKSALAQYIHDHSPRRETGAFVDCAIPGIARGLLHSHLAGHRKGAFTGAFSEQKGKVEAAHRGTLFLDELEAARKEVQGVLLTLLDQRTVTRVGDTRPLNIDVRLIAATNADLPARIAAGKFRQDLRDRFGYCVIVLPPLRDRREEILPLARHFLALDAGQLERAPTELSPEVRNSFLSAAWPGNVRQLQMVCRFAILSAGEAGQIEVDDLPPEFRAELGLLHRRRSRRISRERVREVMAQVGGSRRAAARVLEVDRKQIQRLLKD